MNEASTKQRSIDELVSEAVEGSRSALEEIVLRVKQIIDQNTYRVLTDRALHRATPGHWVREGTMRQGHGYSSPAFSVTALFK